LTRHDRTRPLGHVPNDVTEGRAAADEPNRWGWEYDDADAGDVTWRSSDVSKGRDKDVTEGSGDVSEGREEGCDIGT
jgi:hypothetical protein